MCIRDSNESVDHGPFPLAQLKKLNLIPSMASIQTTLVNNEVSKPLFDIDVYKRQAVRLIVTPANWVVPASRLVGRYGITSRNLPLPDTVRTVVCLLYTSKTQFQQLFHCFWRCCNTGFIG